VTDDLRTRIAHALRDHDRNMDGGNPAHDADDGYGCCADAVMAVIEPGLAARGAALRTLMAAAEKLALDWPNPGRPERRQAVTRAINQVEVLFGDVITVGRGTTTARKVAAGPEDYSEAGIAAWYAATYLKCASCDTPDTVKPLTFRLPNGGGELCSECAKPVIESTRAIEELIARKKAREAAA
jgi:hypothetical protein